MQIMFAAKIMRNMQKLRKFLKLNRLNFREQGFAMVEVLVALAIAGLAGVCFLISLSTVSKATITTDKHSIANSVAISQMEYVLSQDYDNATVPPQYSFISDIPVGCSINMTAQRLDPENDGTGDDDGIQEIQVAVYAGNEQVIELTSRKVNTDYGP